MTALAPTAPAQISPLAVARGARRRGPAARTMPVYGLCVHTTGSGPATKARSGRATALQIALDYYVNGNEGFPHYVIDYDGSIHAVCDEDHVAWHAGWYARGGKKRWLSWTAPAWWSSVWQRWNVPTPAALLPAQAGDPNSVYIGVELLADTSGWGFTSPQYDALARLVVDVFRRHGVQLSEPPNPRLLGHEDLEPVDRANAEGGWDPGAHRRVPKFSWPALWARIQAGGASGPAVPAPAPAPAPPAPLPAEATAAVARGERDPNRLTDIVFFAQHPERSGRPIAAGEAQAVQEWIRIRDEVVLPLLARAAAPPPPPGAPPGTPPASAFTKAVPLRQRFAALVPLLDRYRGDLPLEFLLGWTSVESGGRIDETTKPPLDERGFFQVSREESRDHRPPFDHLRISSDPDYSVQAGLELVRYYVKLARQRFPWIPAGSDLFWRVVKLQHAMGSGLSATLLGRMRARGIEITWDAIKRFELSPEGVTLHPLMRVDPGRFGRNVDRVFNDGRQIAQSLGR
jgi:hypothetical protein